jgi:Calcium binding
VAGLSKAELGELVAEAVVDAHDEDEQLSGFFCVIEENLALPFKTMVLGVEVSVANIELGERGIAAVCVRGTDRQPIDFLQLPVPASPPPGWEWVAAYQYWAGLR